MQRQKKVRITGIERPEPNVRLYVLALIELARELEKGPDSSIELAGTEAEGQDTQ